jgi:ribokinase
MTMTIDVAVVGQIARDLVLVVPTVPAAETAVAVRSRREMLGGKGANQAVGLAQLGVSVGLVGVVGDDAVGGWLLEQARRDGIDTTAVIQRPETSSGLIVDIVDETHQWRYLEDLPDPVKLTKADVQKAAGLLENVRCCVIQLQQPSEAVLSAAELTKAGGGRVILDGAPADDERRSTILAGADVLRADSHEAELLLGRPITSENDAVEAASKLLEHGPSIVALAAGSIGNVFADTTGHVVVPLSNTEVADTTGAGDALVAAFTASLLRGEPYQIAARHGAAAAQATVGHPGGRPALDPTQIFY